MIHPTLVSRQVGPWAFWGELAQFPFFRQLSGSLALKLTLNSDMSQQRERYSPPHTPPSQTARFKPKRGYSARPSIRDAFPDAMENPQSESGDDRDPHDLSLSPQHAARTSIVDNMLLSLDQFAPTSSVLDDYRLFNSAFENDHSHFSQDSTHGRYRGHTFSSSQSSEPEYGYEDGSGRYATLTATKGRRSNSSSTYQTAPRHAGSSRGGDALSLIHI